MLLGEDGAILYVLNPYTNDVSIFDVAKQDVVDIVYTGGGSSRIVQLPGDPAFWVQSREKLVHFDTATNGIDRTIDFKPGFSYRTVTYETAHERVWVTTNSKLQVFDLRTGEAVGQADLPKIALAFWIDNSREPWTRNHHLLGFCRQCLHNWPVVRPPIHEAPPGLSGVPYAQPRPTTRGSHPKGIGR
jgi:hypothetical protein